MERADDLFHLHAARTFDEHHIPLLEPALHLSNGLLVALGHRHNIGGEAALPALAKLLQGADTAGMACLALGSYTSPKANETLRAALSAASRARSAASGLAKKCTFILHGRNAPVSQRWPTMACAALGHMLALYA